MLMRNGQMTGLGDLGFSLNPVKGVRSLGKKVKSAVSTVVSPVTSGPFNPFKVASAIQTATSGITSAANTAGKFGMKTAWGAGRLATAPSLLANKLAVQAGKGLLYGAGRTAGAIVRAPYDVAKAGAVGFASKFKSAQAARQPGSEPTQTTPTHYSAGGSSGPSSGGDPYGSSSSALTTSGAEQPPAEAPQTLGEKFAAMSTPMKLALAAAVAGGIYFIVKKKGGASGRRSKS